MYRVNLKTRRRIFPFKFSLLYDSQKKFIFVFRIREKIVSFSWEHNEDITDDSNSQLNTPVRSSKLNGIKYHTQPSI